MSTGQGRCRPGEEEGGVPQNQHASFDSDEKSSKAGNLRSAGSGSAPRSLRSADSEASAA